MKAEAVTSRARHGAFWSLAIAASFFPIPYVRNWFFSSIDPVGTVAGTYFMVLLLLQAVQSFFFPGGRNVLPTFLPKLSQEQDRARLITGYFYCVLGGAVIGVLVLTIWPDLPQIVLRREIDANVRDAVRLILPIILLDSYATSLLMSRMAFALATFLLRSQLIITTAIAAGMYFTDSQALLESPVVWFGGAVAAASIVNLLIAAGVLFRRVKPTARGFLPPGCIRFAGLAHLDTLLVFGYGAIDRLFIAAYLGLAPLGDYFLLLTIAQIIPRAAQELGHLILTTFSKLLGMREEERLADGYRRVTRLIIGAYAALSIPIILFSKPLAGVFGPACAAEYRWLILLAVAMNVDCLRTINGMTLMAYERMRAVLASKFAQNLVQLALTAALISRFGVVGVIVALGAGHAARALSLIWSVRCLKADRPLLPPRAFYISQVLVFIAGAVAYSLDGPGTLVALALTVILGATLWLTGGFSKSDVLLLIPRRKPSEGGTP